MGVKELQHTPATMPRAMLSNKMIYPKKSPMTEQINPITIPIAKIAPCAAR